VKDWFRVTYNGKQYLTQEFSFISKLAKKKNKNKAGRYYLDNGIVTFWEPKVLGKWKCERFADKACTKRVKVE
jgi:hypothetical protein